MRKAKPYSVGFMGHAKVCDCEDCAVHRAGESLRMWKEYGAKAEIDPEKTVFVRAFWRKQAGHLRTKPNTLKALRMQLTYTRKWYPKGE